MNARPLLLVVLLAACGASSSTPADAVAPDAAPADAPLAADTPLAADSAPDLPPRDLPAADAALATPVKFVLRNETGRTIYVQQGGFWRLLREGTRLQPEHNCGLCSCEDVGCRVCGKALDVALALDPGGTQSWMWDGRTWRFMRVGTGMSPVTGMLDYECPEPVPAGPLTVQADYSFTKEDKPPESYVGPTVTVEQTFQHPPAADVVLVAR